MGSPDNSPSVHLINCQQPEFDLVWRPTKFLPQHIVHRHLNVHPHPPALPNRVILGANETVNVDSVIFGQCEVYNSCSDTSTLLYAHLKNSQADS